MVHIISIAEQIRELQDTSTKPPRSVHYGAHYDNGRTGLSSQHSGQTDEAGGRAPQDTTPTIEDPVLRIRQRMQQSTIGVLSGTQAKSLGGTEALYKATMSGVLRESRCRKANLPQTTNGPLTSGKNLLQVANWDHTLLYEALPAVPPVFMGKSWTPENTNFDISALHLTNLTRDDKIQIEPMLRQNLDTVVSSTGQYSNALTRLALDDEALSVQVACELVKVKTQLKISWSGGVIKNSAAAVFVTALLLSEGTQLSVSGISNVKSDINFCFYAKNVFYLKFDGFF